MRVIDQGKGNPGWRKRFVCTECEATLEVDESDLKVINTAVAYGGESWEPELVFYCGVCHSENGVTNKVPSGIQYKLFEEAEKKRN